MVTREKQREHDLEVMADLLRRDVLSMTTAAGSGHPTSCLSCAEVMSVLFFDELRYLPHAPQNPSNDEFILSKGHAAPILYASLFRAGCISHDLLKLRTLKSPLEGHPVPASLAWVKVATGSLGQGLSVGVGMALAARINEQKSRVYVLLGDSEIAEGSVYEAMQLAAHLHLSNLVALVDVNRLGQRGETMQGHDMSSYKKRFLGFGWEVIVVNGHSVSAIQAAFSRAKKSSRPVMMLLKTHKGHGISFLEDKEHWHGKTLNPDECARALKELPDLPEPVCMLRKPASVRQSRRTLVLPSVTRYKKGDVVATRTAYGAMLAKLAHRNRHVLALDAEVSNSTGADAVLVKTPRQFIETFICEQNMIGVALGLSKKGFCTASSTFAAFLTRAHDQLRMASLSDASMIVCGSHAGVSIGPDGASQMGLDDIALFRGFFGSTVLYPSDAVSCEKLLLAAAKNTGITYLRTSRPKLPVLYSSRESFRLGEFKVLKQSRNDVLVLVGSGVTVHECLFAYELLKAEGISVAVVDAYSIKPFAHTTFAAFVAAHGGRFVVSEDHMRAGGVYEMITAGMAASFPSIGLAVDTMPHSGTPEELLAREGIDATAIRHAVQRLLS